MEVQQRAGVGGPRSVSGKAAAATPCTSVRLAGNGVDEAMGVMGVTPEAPPAELGGAHSSLPPGEVAPFPASSPSSRLGAPGRYTLGQESRMPTTKTKHAVRATLGESIIEGTLQIAH